jgi:hypothetical protein
VSPEEIRSLYVETLARADYGRWQSAYDKISEQQEWGDKAPPWDQAGEDHKRKVEAIRKAEMIADDLGHLLPVEAWTSTDLVKDPGHKRRAYVTPWQEIPE